MSSDLTSKKTILLFSLGSVLILLLFTTAMVVDFNRITPVQPFQVTTVSLLQWSIDPVAYGARYVTLTGWALIPGEAPLKFDTTIVLKNTQTGAYIAIPTTLVINQDLNKTFSDGIDYSQSGFLAKVDRVRIGLDQTPYQVFIKYFDNDHQYYINTGITLTGK